MLDDLEVDRVVLLLLPEGGQVLGAPVRHGWLMSSMSVRTTGMKSWAGAVVTTKMNLWGRVACSRVD